MTKSSLNLGFRFVKILDIGYTTFIYFMMGLIIAGIIDILYGKYDEKAEKEKSFYRRSLDLVGMIWLNGVIIYFIRNVAELIPSPFDGYYGFKHNRLKELDSAYVFDFVLIYNQPNLIKRMDILLEYIKAFIFKYYY